jgi:putative ABC transport system substrate-binding protein
VIKEVELAAKAFGLKLQNLDVLDSKGIETAFRAASKGQSDGVLVLASAVLVPQRVQLAELAVKHRLPTIYSNSQYVDVGGLVFYGANVLDLDRRAPHMWTRF